MSGLYSTDRPEFLERVAALAGKTTFRVPHGARGARQDQMPDAHAIAAALAYARRGQDDIGPDVAFCFALQNDTYKPKVVRLLADALCMSSSMQREHAVQAIVAAWDVFIYNRASAIAMPTNLDKRAWDALLLLACGTLHDSAWDALAEAEKMYFRSS